MSTRKTKPVCIAYGPKFSTDEKSPYADRCRWVENASRGLRVVGPVHEIQPEGFYRRLVNHNGWYLDPFGYGETVHGAVLQLPARNGAALYVPALADPDNSDCYMVNFHDATAELLDAVRWADGMAQQYAEREREYRLMESAKLRAEELREEAKELRAKHSATVADMRALRELAPDAPTACTVLRESLRAMRKRAREALKEAARLADEPWTLLEG